MLLSQDQATVRGFNSRGRVLGRLPEFGSGIWLVKNPIVVFNVIVAFGLWVRIGIRAGIEIEIWNGNGNGNGNWNGDWD